MDSMPPAPETADTSAVTALVQALPSTTLDYNLRARRAGLGSLGRTRYVGLANWQGGRIAREVKAIAPSAALWARDVKGPYEILIPALIENSVRCADPCLTFQGMWQVRRLAPYCTRIELSMLARERDEARLLGAMGFETANIHRGSPNEVDAIRNHLGGLPKKWLKKASKTMADIVEDEFEEYRSD